MNLFPYTHKILFLIVMLLLGSCNTVSVGGGVSGGSNGNVDVGVGIGVHLP